MSHRSYQCLKMFHIFLVFLLTISIANSREFDNPILPDVYAGYTGYTHYKEHYYMVAGNDSMEIGGRFPIYQSKDLQNWKQVGYIFPTAENLPIWGNNSFYYPEIRVLSENNFRVYFTAGPKIGVASATNILGPYVASSQPLIQEPSSDSNLLIDNGVLVLYWITPYPGTTTILARKLTPDGLSVSSESASTVLSTTLKWENRKVISPNVFKRNNMYYLFYGAYGGGSIGVARSLDPLGSFTKRGEPIFRPQPNDGRTANDPTVIQDVDGVSAVLIYTEHFYDDSNNQYMKLQMAKSLSWDENGWPYVS